MKKYLALISLVGALSACSKDIQSIEAAKNSIELKLSDPSSVQYREVAAYSEGVVCGEVNAKNKMGGYVGFQAFVYDGTAVELNVPVLTRLNWCNNVDQQKHLKANAIKHEEKTATMQGLLDLYQERCDRASSDPPARADWCKQSTQLKTEMQEQKKFFDEQQAKFRKQFG